MLGFDRQLEFEVDGELYWKFRPNQTGYVWMGDATFRSPATRINNLGLRGRDVAPDSTAAFRILTLGDSYTFGSGVRDDETFSAVLERDLGPARVEVINGGVPGYGIFQVQRQLNRLVPLLHPQMVIVTIPTGDILRQPFADPERERRYLKTEAARKRLRQLSQLATFVYRRLYYLRARLRGWGTAGPDRGDIPDNATFMRRWQSDEARLAAMADTCRAAGAHLVILAWPQPRYQKWQPILEGGIKALTAREGVVALFGLDAAFRSYPDDALKIPGDGHPSAMGHEVVGDYLAQAVRELMPDGGVVSNVSAVGDRILNPVVPAKGRVDRLASPAHAVTGE